MPRAFFAIPLANREQQHIQHAIKSLRAEMGEEVHWIRPENWHITLRFLGKIDAVTVERLAQVAERAAAGIQKIDLQMSKIAGFPAEKSRMIAAYVMPHPSLTDLFLVLDQAAVDAGLTREDREFNPHITLAKARRQVKYFSPIVFDAFTFTAQELILYESKPTDEGSHYLPLRKISFLKEKRAR